MISKVMHLKLRKVDKICVKMDIQVIVVNECKTLYGARQEDSVWLLYDLKASVNEFHALLKPYEFLSECNSEMDSYGLCKAWNFML